MKCLECGKVLRSVNSSHLKNCCGLTIPEYLTKHPGAELLDEDVRKSYGKPMEQNPNWRGGTTYKTCELCGKDLSRRNSVSRCPQCRQKGKSNPFQGKRHSDHTKAKMKEKARTRDKATYKYGNPDKVKLSQAQKARWDKMSTEQKATYLTSFISAGHKHCKKNKNTKIELVVKQLLDDLGVDYTQHMKLGDYYVDFVLEGVVIEVYGDYWHLNPVKYVPEFYSKSLKMTASEKWEKDEIRLCKIADLGYRVLVIWENDIMNNIHTVTSKLTELLSEKKIEVR